MTERSPAALVTGASRGLGRAVAERLAADGLAVAVNYRRAAGQAEAVVQSIVQAGGHAVALQADVAQPQQAADLVNRAEAELGPLQVLVNNAGVTNDRLLLQMSEGDWDVTWLPDLAGPRSSSRAALRLMGPRGFGRIINVSSVVGATGNAGQANYAAAKSAVLGLTRELAVQAASRGVTINCVIPGYFATDATAHLSEQQQAAWLRRIPMGRAGSAHDIADLVAFLASHRAGYITGQCIAVDGGLLAAAGFGLAS